jgi:hypothetical protein
MEDARIKSGNGTVDRSKERPNMEGMSVAQYAKKRRALDLGSETQEAMECLKTEQAPLRKHIEEQVKKIASEEARYR